MNKYAFLYTSIVEALVKKAFDPMHPIDSAIGGVKDMYQGAKGMLGHGANAAKGFITGQTANVANEAGQVMDSAAQGRKGLGNAVAGGAVAAGAAATAPMWAPAAAAYGVGKGVVDRVQGTMQGKNVADLNKPATPAAPATPVAAAPKPAPFTPTSLASAPPPSPSGNALAPVSMGLGGLTPAPKPSPSGNALAPIAMGLGGTPAAPAPAANVAAGPDDAFLKKTMGSYDPNSAMDRRKADAIRKIYQPGMTAGQVYGNKAYSSIA